MSEENETLTVTSRELEYAFAQAARFGAWMHFAYLNEDLFNKVVKETVGAEGCKSLEEIEEAKETEKYRESMIKLCWMFMNETPSGCKVGKTVQKNLSRLFIQEDMWNQIEVFNELCELAQQVKSFNK